MPRFAPPRLLVPILLVCGLAFAGCGSSGADAGGGRLDVVATTTQLGDFAREVGGDDVTVTQILKPNSDPHDYEPRPDDVRAAAAGKLVLESGDNLDKWMADVVEQGGGDPEVVDLSTTNVQRLPGEATGEEASKYDPHWWHDPRNVEAAVAGIASALADADPDHRAGYASRAKAYIAKVRGLDAGIRRCMQTVPAADRKLVTDHDAFDYFARRYAITVVGAIIPSQTTQAESSAKDVSALSRLIREEGVKAVFPESSINPKLAKAIAAQTGATADLQLYGDTLGGKGSSGATYLSMEAHNADAMVKGFTGGKAGCSALA